MFDIKSDHRVSLRSIDDPRLRGLLDYWCRICAGRALPAWVDVDLAALEAHKTRLHIIEVQGRNRFLFRVYGSAVTNPDAFDMTGLTTDDYRDTAFGEMVTRHLQDCVEQRMPVYRHIVASLDDEPYEYFRLILPLVDDSGGVDMLLISPVRVTVPVDLPERRVLSTGWPAGQSKNPR